MSGIYFQQICYFLCCPDAGTGKGCEFLREPIRRQVMEQIGSITIHEYEMQESFELG